MTSSSSLEAPIVREALAADTAALALLMSELGYPVTPEGLSSRLAKMPSAHCTFVAELDGAIAGFVGCSALDIYESDTPVGWVMALCGGALPSARRRPGTTPARRALVCRCG